MASINKKAVNFLNRLLEDEGVKDLENYDDQGVKITAHTYDVFRLSIEEIKRTYKNLEDATKDIDLFSVVVGVIVHDFSKGSLRKSSENISHSQAMLKNPEYIIKETENLLKKIQDSIGVELKESVIKSITHIVVSHHGKWGKVIPSTKEANIVHWADMYSAKYHRINPLNVNDILGKMIKGINLVDVSKEFKVTLGIAKDRLKKSRIELKIGTNHQLLNYYKKNKKVPIGDEFFTKRIEDTGKLIQAVEKKGLRELVMTNEVLDYLDDRQIFEDVENENK